MLMKVLYVVLALSIVAIIAAVVALLWRLRSHLGRKQGTPANPMQEVSPEQDPAKKA
jgi:hypothetical protein